MRVRLEKSLKTWSEEAGYTYHGNESVLDLDIVKGSDIYRRLRTYGFSRDAAIATASFYGNIIEHGFALAPDLRVLCWYWPSGDKVIFPVNSRGSIYIGNSPEFWFDFYPFLNRCSQERHIYQCSLTEYNSPFQTGQSRCLQSLYIGGQTHFGHFIVDKFAPLLTLANIAKTLSFDSFIVPPEHRAVTREMLIVLMRELREESSSKQVFDSDNCQIFELPKVSGLHFVGPAWVPADNHRPDSLRLANQRLFGSTGPSFPLGIQANKQEEIRSTAYVSRFPAEAGEHDRISNYQEVKEFLEANSVDHIYPTDLSLKERLLLFSSYDLLISDSGSCCLNALLFSRPGARVFQFQSKRLLEDSSELATSQHYKSLPLIGTRLFSIPGESSKQSAANSWYDKININVNDIASAI